MNELTELKTQLFSGCVKVFGHMLNQNSQQDFYAFGMFICGNFTFIKPAANTISAYRACLKDLGDWRSYQNTTLRYSPMEWQHTGNVEDGAGTEFDRIYELLSDYLWNNCNDENRLARMSNVVLAVFETLDRLRDERIVFRRTGCTPLLICSEFDGSDELLELTSLQYFLSEEGFERVKSEFRSDSSRWEMLKRELDLSPDGLVARVRNALGLPGSL